MINSRLTRALIKLYFLNIKCENVTLNNFLNLFNNALYHSLTFLKSFLKFVFFKLKSFIVYYFNIEFHKLILKLILIKASFLIITMFLIRLTNKIMLLKYKFLSIVIIFLSSYNLSKCESK